MMAAGAANGLDVRGDDSISPLKWDDWLKLPIREEDHVVNTPRGLVRVPTVIVASNYSKVPLCRPRFGARGIWKRDGGICQYTGRKLAPGHSHAADPQQSRSAQSAARSSSLSMPSEHERSRVSHGPPPEPG